MSVGKQKSVCATNTASSILATVRAHNASGQSESSKVRSIVMVGKVHNNGEVYQRKGDVKKT